MVGENRREPNFPEKQVDELIRSRILNSGQKLQFRKTWNGFEILKTTKVRFRKTERPKNIIDFLHRIVFSQLKRTFNSIFIHELSRIIRKRENRKKTEQKMTISKKCINVNVYNNRSLDFSTVRYLKFPKTSQKPSKCINIFNTSLQIRQKQIKSYRI